MKSILLHYAQARKEDEPIQFLYDWKTAMNYIIEKGKRYLFIEKGADVLTLMTKTEAYSEQDDHANSSLELMTKTFTQREADDTSINNY